MDLQQSSARPLVFKLVDFTDGLTAEQSVAFGDVLCYYSKDGAAQVEKIVATEDWAPVVGVTGHYYLDFTAGELDTVGTFSLAIISKTDAFRQSDQAHNIVTADLNALKILIDAAKADTAAILIDTSATLPNEHTAIEDKIDIIDANIDALLGTGSQSIIFHAKDNVPNNIEDVSVTVYDSGNTIKKAGPKTTNASGNTDPLNLDPGAYKIRLSKSGAVNETQSKTVTVDATIECEVTVTTPSVPSSSEVCRVRLYVTDISNANTTGEITGITQDPYTQIAGKAVKHVNEDFILDTGTTPHHYYLDVHREISIFVTGTKFGVNHPVDVPDAAEYVITSGSIIE